MSAARPTVRLPGEPSGPGRLRLLVLKGGVTATHALPDQGCVAIGRGEGVDIQIDDPSISRQHARLHLGVPLRLEDLGSANGTQVRDRRLEANEIVEIVPGDAFELGETMLVVQRAKAVVREARQPLAAEAPIAPADAMLRLRRLVERVASSPISVLILGETGVGKSLLAAEIHQRSPRAAGSFVALNCAALPEALLESELFGHEKGAFSGASNAKPGLFEAAERGTVFLDEIGELPLSMQAKLLQVLEQREVRRVGGLHPRPIDVRVLAASNRDLESEAAQGAFRQDLYYRLNGISLFVPPLRQRRDEIAGLARAFMAQACAEARRSDRPELSREAIDLLQRHTWPGNIRELRNAIERAVLLSDGGPITPEHLPLEKVRATTIVPQPAAAAIAPPIEGREEEKRRIAAALEECGGNQGRAAELLGISRRTLVSRLGEYGLPRPRKR